MTKPLLLFDMDGTLLDTRHDIARAANSARVELGLPPMSVEDVVRAVGDGVNLFVSRVTYPTTDDRFQNAKTVFMRHYAENVVGETIPYSGIEDLLEQLHSEGFPMGVASNKPWLLVDVLVKHFSWQKYFKVWLGGDSAPTPKPSADPIWMALERCGLPRNHRVIMIGDGPQDILAAKSADCQALWCSWGFNPAATSDYPSVTIDHPRDVMRHIY
jgi:phosphoglycolate phosphatase